MTIDDLYPVISDDDFRSEGYFEGYCVTKHHEEMYQEKAQGMGAWTHENAKYLLKDRDAETFYVVASEHGGAWKNPLPTYVDQNDRYVIPKKWLRDIQPRKSVK